MKRAIFLDRDGVINIDKNYVHKIEDFEFAKGAKEALKHFLDDRYILIVITNQSGIGRGYYTKKDFEKLTNWMLNELKKDSIFIKKVYFCPHKPEDKCECRKPNPKMILDAKKEFNLDLKNSWLIGDKESDIEAGLNAGIKKTILIGDRPSKAKYVVKSILDTISIIRKSDEI